MNDWDAINIELAALGLAIRQNRHSQELLEPVDAVELLRMLREVRRFVEVPVPEERMPF